MSQVDGIFIHDFKPVCMLFVKSTQQSIDLPEFVCASKQSKFSVYLFPSKFQRMVPNVQVHCPLYPNQASSFAVQWR